MLFICNKCIFLCVDDANKICIVLYCIVTYSDMREGVGMHRCNRLYWPPDILSLLQCYHMGHDGQWINLYVVRMILMDNLHAGGHSVRGCCNLPKELLYCIFLKLYIWTNKVHANVYQIVGKWSSLCVIKYYSQCEKSSVHLPDTQWFRLVKCRPNMYYYSYYLPSHHIYRVIHIICLLIIYTGWFISLEVHSWETSRLVSQIKRKSHYVIPLESSWFHQFIVSLVRTMFTD